MTSITDESADSYAVIKLHIESGEMIRTNLGLVKDLVLQVSKDSPIHNITKVLVILKDNAETDVMPKVITQRDRHFVNYTLEKTSTDSEENYHE